VTETEKPPEKNVVHQKCKRRSDNFRKHGGQYSIWARVFSDQLFGPADGGTVTGNKVAATHIFDGIELCGSSNTVQSNRINGSDESAIHVDSSCGPVTNNVISGNTIIEACAGIPVGTAAGSNSIGSNTFFNARNTVLTADSCTPPLIAARPANTSSVNTSSVAKSPRPSPARP
jgi:hypothetical protein